jgi:uncharacterized protein YigE (DUF2233 family)
MKRSILSLAIFLVIPLFMSNAFSADATKWKVVSKGLDYASIRVSPGIIHALRIDPKVYKFGVVTAKAMGRKNASVTSMAKKYGALVAINGGFFTPEYDSLGLLINNGKTINPVKNTSWWSIFYVENSLPKIAHTKSFKKKSNISMAVQSGPRLVVNGSVPKLKPSIAERSAICITPRKDVIIVATENLLIQPSELADYLRKSGAKGGLGCKTALNLDGGSSTQLYAKIGSFRLDVPGTNKVANAVVVYPKSK